MNKRRNKEDRIVYEASLALIKQEVGRAGGFMAYNRDYQGWEIGKRIEPGSLEIALRCIWTFRFETNTWIGAWHRGSLGLVYPIRPPVTADVGRAGFERDIVDPVDLLKASPEAWKSLRIE